MKIRPLLLLLLLSSLNMTVLGAQPTIPPCGDPSMVPDQAKVPCAGILTFSQGLQASDRENVVRKHGAKIRFNFKLQNAAAVIVPSYDALIAIHGDPAIIDVIPDRLVHAMPKPTSPGAGKDKNNDTSGQVVPSGVARIGAAPDQLSVNGNGVGVAIGDTGLDMLNPDLNIGALCFTAYSSCYDGNGHGTHVAGIVAAKNNNIDVVGVASAATVYAVKILDDNGSGSDSSVMAGMEWIAINADSVSPKIKVVNMSLGRDGSLNDNPLLHESIRHLVEDLDISVVVSAGNDANKAVTDKVPATYPEVIAVASTTSENGNNQRCRAYSGIIAADTASYFTTDGSFNNATSMGVSISAPGARQENISRSCFVNSDGILSLKVGGGVTRMSGTSMAAPHVSGVAALLLEDSAGVMKPVDIRDKIRQTADRKGVAPLDSPTTSYSYDGEREGVLSACGALGENC